MSKGKFEFLDGYPADVLAIEAVGEIGADAYEHHLIPALEAKIAAEGKIKLLYVIGDRFDGFSAKAAWDDARFGLTHLGDFAALALVSDIEWVRLGVQVFAPMIPGAFAVFHVAELDKAKAWICEAGKPREDHSHDTDATHKLPTLEDKQPPMG
ncbi:STAS/SEC14 domain-containing protein [Thioclava atlantica]|nr:STAS/SEC14 domain-containing protein [Thioclava atlantica]